MTAYAIITTTTTTTTNNDTNTTNTNNQHRSLWALSLICGTANFPTNIMDFRRFDSSIILIIRGGILTSIGDSPESLSRAMLVGVILIGRLGVPSLFLPFPVLTSGQIAVGAASPAHCGDLRMNNTCLFSGGATCLSLLV